MAATSIAKPVDQQIVGFEGHYCDENGIQDVETVEATSVTIYRFRQTPEHYF